MNSRIVTAAAACLAYAGLAQSASAQEGRMLRTMPHGAYQCALPGDANGAAFEEVPEASFSIGTASRYTTSDGGGTYLLQGRELLFTSGPKKGDRFKRVGSNRLQMRKPDGSLSKLLCTRLGATG